MPDDPTLQDSVAPRVTQAPDLPEAATADTFGGNVGNALESAGEVATKIHHDAVAEANDAWHQQAFVQLNQATQGIFYQQKTGLFNQQLGQMAVPRGDQALVSYDNAVNQIKASATNPQQVAAFTASANEHRAALARQVAEYQHREFTGWQDQQTSAFIQAHLDQIAQDPTDPWMTAGHIQAIQGAVKLAQERKGIDSSSDAGQQGVAEATSQAHMTALTAMVSSGQDQGASAYLQDNRAGFSNPRQLAEADRMVGDASTAGQAQRMLHQFTLDDQGQPVSAEEFLQRVDNDKTLQDPANVKLLDAVTERGSRFLSAHRQATDQAQADAFEEAKGYVGQPGNLQGIQDPRAIALQGKMSSVQWDTLAALARKDDTVNPYPRSSAIVQGLRSMIANGQAPTGPDGKPAGASPRQQVAAMNGLDYVGVMDPKDWGEIFGPEGLQKRLGTSGVKDPEVAKLVTMQAIQKEGYSSIGLPAEQAKWTADQWKTANDFDQNLSDRIAATEALSGQKLKPEDARAIMQQSLIDRVRVNGTVTPAYAVKPAQAIGGGLALTRDEQLSQEGTSNTLLADRAIQTTLAKFRTPQGAPLDPAHVRPGTMDQIRALGVAAAAAKARGDTATMDALADYTNHLLAVEQGYGADQLGKRKLGPAPAVPPIRFTRGPKAGQLAPSIPPTPSTGGTPGTPGTP